MPCFDVMRANRFFRQFDAFTIGIGLSIPPTVLIKGTESIDKHDLAVWSKSKFFLSIDVNQSVLCRFPFNHIINPKHSVKDSVQLVLGNVGNLKGLLIADVPIICLELCRNFEERLLQFGTVLAVCGDAKLFRCEFATLEPAPCRP